MQVKNSLSYDEFFEYLNFVLGDPATFPPQEAARCSEPVFHGPTVDSGGHHCPLPLAAKQQKKKKKKEKRKKKDSLERRCDREMRPRRR
jgi:hypothetical protein